MSSRAFARLRRQAHLVLVRGVVAGLLLSTASVARAETNEPASLKTYHYRLTPEPNYLRATIEEVIILGGESLQYWKDRNINSEDWDLSYSWSSFEDKLTGVAYAFDTNRFETNFAYHPIAGMLYYLAPRNNRMTVLESLGFAFASSAFWELVVEFREKVSINDLWVTPLSGMALGETTAQLGAFFDRGCATSVNRALGFAFGPLQTVHDKLDGVTPLRPQRCDQLGFDLKSQHRFRFSLGAAELRTSGSELYRVVRGKLETSIVNLPDTEHPVTGWRTFADGNLSDMTLGFSYGAGKVADALIDTRATLAGAEYRRLLDGTRALGFGDRATLGVLVGAQYSLHRYEPTKPADRVFLLDAPAMSMRLVGRRAGYGFALQLDAGATFGGMDALALEVHRARAGSSGLTTIADQQRYNYVAGVALSPSARLELDGVELGFKARSERVTAIYIWGRHGNTPNGDPLPDHEQRRHGELWLSTGPRIGPRLTLSVEATERSGSLGASERRLTEMGVGLSLGAAL